MKLIVGLGNKGEEYKDTRHNAGFMAIDQLLGRLGHEKKFSTDKKFESEIVKLKNVILVRPQTFMNNSGRAVRKIMDYYKIKDLRELDKNDLTQLRKIKFWMKV